MPMNKSNKGPTNSSLMASIGERSRDFTTRTAQERSASSQREHAAEAAEAGELAIELGLPNEYVPMQEKLNRKMYERIDRLNPRLAQFVETRHERSINGVRTDISRNFEQTRSGINGLSFGSVAIAAGTANMNVPYSELETRQTQQQAKMSILEQLSSRRAGRLYQGDEINGVSLGRIGMFDQRREKLQEEMAGTTASMRMQRVLGQDPNSMMKSRMQTLGRAEGILSTNEAQEQVATKTGMGAMSSGDLNKTIADSASKLTKAFDDLIKGVSGADAAFDAAAKTLKEAEAIRAAGGGGGGASNIDKFNFAGSAFGAAANAAQQIGVNQSLAAKYNAAGLAGIENQKYAMFQKASAGDVQSQMLLSKWNSAEDFGSKIKTAANTAVSLQVAGGAAQTTAAGIKLAEAGGEKGNPFSYLAGTATANSAAAYESAGQMAQGISNTTIGTADLGRGISGNQAKIAAITAQMELERQISAVPAAQLQGFRDFSTGMGVAARGMGSGGGAFLRGLQGDSADARLMKTRNGDAVNEGILPRMAQEGISPEQMAQMAQSGQASMGSMFSTEQIFQARGLEKSGYGTIAENQQRQASLAAAGSNNPQAGLSSVLEAAFGKSLENAKTLTALVENTGAMAGKSVGGRAGLDVTAATATMLATGIDPSQGNKEFAIQRARSAAETADSIITDQSNSYVNMSALTRIGNLTGLKGQSQVFAGQLDMETINTNVNESDPEKQAAFLRGQGVGADKGNASHILKGLQKAAGIKLLEAGTLGTGGNASKLYDKIRAGETLTNDDHTAIGAAAKVAHFASDNDLIRTVQGTFAKNDPNASTEVKKIEAGTASSEELKKADKLLTSGFSQLANAADAAAKQLGGAAKAMEKLVALQDETNKRGGVQNETKAGMAARNASEANMLDGAGKVFSNATDNFKTSVDILLKGLGGKPQVTSGNANNDSKHGKSPGQ